MHFVPFTIIFSHGSFNVMKWFKQFHTVEIWTRILWSTLYFNFRLYPHPQNEVYYWLLHKENILNQETIDTRQKQGYIKSLLRSTINKKVKRFLSFCQKKYEFANRLSLNSDQQQNLRFCILYCSRLEQKVGL